MRIPFAHRRAPLIAIVSAVLVGAALASACACLLETALRLDTPPHRLAAADLVVAAPEHATLAAGAGRPAQRVTLAERPRLPRAVAGAVAAVPGVARVAPVQGVTGALAVDVRAGASPGRTKEALAAALAGRHLTVLDGDERGRAEAAGVAGDRLALILLSGIFGGMALVVMALLLGSIVSLAVEQRSRELGLLRTIGATPKQIRRLLVRRTMRPAALAAAAGAVLGRFLADGLFDRLQDAGVVASVVALRASALAILAGGAAAWLATRASVGLTARAAGRVRTVDAVNEDVAPARVGRVRAALAVVALAGAASCAVMTPFMPAGNAAAVGGGTALAGVIACALLAPVLAERVADRLAPTARRLGGLPGGLAVANLRARAGRTGALLIPVILVVSIALANAYQQTTQGDAIVAAYTDGVRADAVVTARDGRALPRSAVAAARTAGTVSGLVYSTGWIEHPVDKAHRVDPLTLIGADGAAVAAPVERGSLRALRGDAVALPAGLAADLRIAAGDRIGLVLGDGAHVTVRVAALLGGFRRYPALVLPPALLAMHTGSGVRELLIEGGGDVRSRAARALRDLPGVTIRGGDAVRDDVDTGLRVDRWITFAVIGVIVAYAAMSLVNLLTAALGGRRRELALLRMAGATRRQVARMLQAEAMIIVAGGIAIGTLVAIAGLVPLAVATAGSPLPSGSPAIFVAVAAVAVGLVLAPTTATARRLLRGGPAAGEL
jgi:putative ABC transport system permease protein